MDLSSITLNVYANELMINVQLPTKIRYQFICLQRDNADFAVQNFHVDFFLFFYSNNNSRMNDSDSQYNKYILQKYF